MTHPTLTSIVKMHLVINNGIFLLTASGQRGPWIWWWEPATHSLLVLRDMCRPL